MIRALGEIGVLLGRSVRSGARIGVDRREVLRQFHGFANDSAGLVVAGMTFFGVVMVTIANSQARKLTGSLAVVGAAYCEILVREFGPLLAAILAAARSGASHSAELAQMSVNEQVEALELSGGDVYADLLLPRILGCALALPFLAALGTVAASLSAAGTAHFLFDTDAYAFLDPRYLDWGDVLASATKAVACGIFIPLAAARRALGASGGSLAVGWATTHGVVAATIGCLAIDFIIALAFRFLQG